MDSSRTWPINHQLSKTRTFAWFTGTNVQVQWLSSGLKSQLSNFAYQCLWNINRLDWYKWIIWTFQTVEWPFIIIGFDGAKDVLYNFISNLWFDWSRAPETLNLGWMNLLISRISSNIYSIHFQLALQIYLFPTDSTTRFPSAIEIFNNRNLTIKPLLYK